MNSITIQSIIQNYQLLADHNLETREQANNYLLNLIDTPQVWIIAKEMIANLPVPDYQLLGAQILYQKVERDIAELTLPLINQLKQFVFGQLMNDKLNFATIRKLASAAALIAISLILDSWPSFLPDMVRFMEGSVLQLQSGLAVLERLPQELKQNNHIKHSVKTLIKQSLLQKSDLLCHVYCSAIMLNQSILTEVALSGLQSWIYIGFPIMKYTEMVQLIIKLFNVDDLYLQSCCKILREGLKHTARDKYQSISESQFMIEHQKYSKVQLLSLQEIVQYIRGTKLGIFSSVQSGSNSQQIEIYTSIIKEMLLSYGFLLKQQLGYELIEMMFLVLEKGDLKLSYSTFEFWIDFCDKIEKMKVDQMLQIKFWQIVEHLLDVILQRTLLDNETLHSELIKEDDTLDDITKISITQYRKQAENLIKFTFDYFSTKKAKEGSRLFFQKLIVKVEQFKAKGQLSRGLQLAVYAVKAAQQSMVKSYDTQNMVVFITFVMGEVDTSGNMPAKLIAEVLNLVKDCNHQVKQTESLFLRCLDFCLKYVSDENISHYAVYAFQSLMESINSLGNDSLVNSLMNFYSRTTFSKQTVLQKILEGILTTITKLTNREVVEHYLMRIISSFQAKNKAILSNDSQDQNYYISLIEIKTLLDSFDHFKESDRQYFRPTFLRISSYGIVIVSKIIHTFISKRIKFTTVGELGASLSLLRNALKICEKTSVASLPLQEYIMLLNIIMRIIAANSIELFNEYSDLLDVICRVFSQFVSEKIRVLDEWLMANLPSINNFFMNQIQKATMNSIDPDILKWFFALQESVLLYSRQIYLMQSQRTQIYDIALSSVRFINERGMQRKAVNFLYQCVQMKDVYLDRVEPTLKAVFASIPIMSNLCYINMGRILVCLLQKTDLKTKENIVRQLLQYQPYGTVSKDLKEVMSKLVAFSIDTKLDRFIKGAINDVAQAKNKDGSSDLALHMELRFASWKKQYKRMVKEGVSMNQL